MKLPQMESPEFRTFESNNYWAALSEEKNPEDDNSEIPGQIDVTEAGLEGGLEGASGNPGYSSEVQGVFNIAGALQTVDYFNDGLCNHFTLV